MPAATDQDDRVVVAVDGGNSKTDVVAMYLDGRVAGVASSGASSPHQVGFGGSISRVSQLVEQASGGRRIVQANVYLAGLDLEEEVARYRAEVRTLEWSSPSTVVDNDIFALLRAGSDEADAVAVVCGAGLNAVGIRADGATARFAALGAISGDWGGGIGIGETALWFAARGVDRRSAHTTLEHAVPAALGLESVAAVIEAIHTGTLAPSELGRLAPVVLHESRGGDSTAAGIVDRQAQEIARMAASCISRLDLVDTDLPVVLGGGVLRSGDARLLEGVASWLRVLSPRAQPHLVTSPPLLGSALLALERVGATRAALATATENLRG